MVTATRQPQRAFEEHEVQDVGLEALLGDYFDAREAVADPAAWFRRAKKALKTAVAEKPGLLDRILDGGFVRVGPYVLSGKTLEGGPVEIPEWTSWTPKVAKAGKATDACRSRPSPGGLVRCPKAIAFTPTFGITGVGGWCEPIG